MGQQGTCPGEAPEKPGDGRKDGVCLILPALSVFKKLPVQAVCVSEHKAFWESYFYIVEWPQPFLRITVPRLPEYMAYSCTLKARRFVWGGRAGEGGGLVIH